MSSRAYYLCVALIFEYIGIGWLFGALAAGVTSMTLEGFLLAILYTGMVLVFYFGLGVRYRYRGINPDTRNIMTTADPLYYDPTELEKGH
ncbi:MAG: hypothetical protein ACFFB7_04505 [Candidatus Sifarchaeia archaeon]